MSAESIEGLLSDIMESHPLIEGLIASNSKGEILSSQTIIDIDFDGMTTIAKSVLQIAKNALKVSNVCKKGKIRDFIVACEKGYFIVVGMEDVVLIAIAGLDAKSEIGLIRKTMINKLSEVIYG
ncbi:MAG: hypothetical protein ACTSYT_00640 [Candidatus Asgardarchaeia archaeon]